MPPFRDLTVYSANFANAPRPKIRIQLFGKPIEALLDSGSDVCLISSYLAPQAKLDGTRLDLRMAVDGELKSTKGSLKIEFRIRNFLYIANMHVIDGLGAPHILGRDFLVQEDATLDFGRSCVHIGRQQRQTVYWIAHRNQKSSTGILPPLPNDIHPGIVDLLADFIDVFDSGLQQPTTRTTQHHIALNSGKIVNRRCYPLSPQKRQIVYEQVDEMLAAGVIRPSNSPYSSSPVLLIRPDKKPRFCIDYRPLNELTEDEAANLPRITDAIKHLAGAKYFTVLDLKAGYWQIPLDEVSKPLTAFSLPDGATYEFEVMPFGLKNAPSTFQKLMAGEVPVGYIGKFVQVYLDDIIIFSSTMEDHLRHLRLVQERLELHSLKVSPEKCQIARQDLDYLGFRVHGSFIEPQIKHLDQIREFPVPRTKKQLQSFLGVCGWLREHVPRYSELTAAMTDLLQGKEKPFKWT